MLSRDDVLQRTKELISLKCSQALTPQTPFMTAPNGSFPIPPSNSPLPLSYFNLAETQHRFPYGRRRKQTAQSLPGRGWGSGLSVNTRMLTPESGFSESVLCLETHTFYPELGRQNKVAS